MHPYPESLQRLIHVAANLTEPHPSISGEQTRLRARLIASITLSSVFASISWALVLIALNYPLVAALEFSAALLMLPLYRFSRTAHYERAGLGLVALIHIECIILLLLVPDMAITPMVLLPAYLCSLFFGWTAITLSATFSVGSFVLIALGLPGDWSHLGLNLTILIFGASVIGVFGGMLRYATLQLERQSQQLAHSQARFQAAIDGSIDLFCLLEAVRDSQGKLIDLTIREANPITETTFHRSRRELIGQSVKTIIPPHHHEYILSRSAAVIESRSVLMNELEFMPGVTWEFQLVAVQDGVAISARNITERKLAEKRRVELQIEREQVRVLQQFISLVSHDTRTPLATIKTSLYLLERVEDWEKRKVYLQRIDEQVDRVHHILHDMETLARLDDRSDLTFRREDINEVLQTIVDELQPTAMLRQQTLVLDLQESLPLFDLDWSAIRKALGNLIQNAIQHTPPATTITLRSWRADQQVMVDVIDQGEGIAPEDLPYIFERFYKGNKARTPDGSGSGLGLAIARRVVEAHRGQLTVDANPGGGSRFRVSLPIPDNR